MRIDDYPVHNITYVASAIKGEKLGKAAVTNFDGKVSLSEEIVKGQTIRFQHSLGGKKFDLRFSLLGSAAALNRTRDLCNRFTTSRPAAEKHQERDLACRLAFILSLQSLKYLSPDNRTDLSSRIKSYVASDAYSAIGDPKGLETFKEAFDAARQAKAALEKADPFRAGQLMASGSDAVIRACMFYRFSECEAFWDKKAAEIGLVFKALGALKDCGTSLWQSEAGGAGQPQFTEGSRWSMCGSTTDCEKTFPVTVLRRSADTLTLQMPAGTLDVSESQIEIVSLEKRTIKILAKPHGSDR